MGLAFHRIMLSKALFFLLSLLQLCLSTDEITPSKPLKDGGEALISKGGKFTLGFFGPLGNTTRRYVGIWFTEVSEQTVVWIANRDEPVRDSRGVLSINGDGNLIISSRGIVLWSTNVSNGNGSTTCRLLDSGNLVLASNDGKTVLWQGFDHLTDTLLMGMKLGLDKRTGLDRYLASWRAPDDPSPGKYIYRVDPGGAPQFLLCRGADVVWRTGPWVGSRWSGVPELQRTDILDYSYVSTPDEVSINYTILDGSIVSRIVLDGPSGSIKWWNWQPGSRRWIEYYSAPRELCDDFGECGDYGSCNPNNGNKFQCECFPGYRPRSPREWFVLEGSLGCVREENRSMCRNGEGFLRIASVKVPDTAKARVNASMTPRECEEACLNNCSCTAYTSSDGSGCITLYGPLIDTKVYPKGGLDLYFRADAVALAKYRKSKGALSSKKVQAALIVVAVLTFTLLVAIIWYWMHNKKREREERRALWIEGSEDKDASSDLPFFSRSEIAAATDNFSFANKLGQGGFGAVYKGQLRNGQEVAVKRLAQNSGQGVQEFKNEVRLIAKLQHRNLVRMLGCCVGGDEKMLVYEFMPNKSLDTFIFKEDRRASLDWRRRFDIILGIARGMLYLHEDSRLRIIHRDLKAGNVLLDKDLVPKIADFGMARIFGGDEVQANTTRVVGTYGYMSPEYALEGLISVKSDVFSFGVLLLEIITGRKNSGFYHDNPSINLVGHVWDLWRDGRALEIVQPPLNEPAGVEKEALTCLQIGLLCVQEGADDRPTMSAVVLMLSNKVELPSPKQPAFIHKGGGQRDTDPSSSSTGAHSANEASVTMTSVEGR